MSAYSIFEGLETLHLWDDFDTGTVIYMSHLVEALIEFNEELDVPLCLDVYINSELLIEYPDFQLYKITLPSSILKNCNRKSQKDILNKMITVLDQLSCYNEQLSEPLFFWIDNSVYNEGIHTANGVLVFSEFYHARRIE